MTFGAYKLVHSESFLDYLYEFWQLLCALYSDPGKKFYIGAHQHSRPWTILQWNILQISQLSVWSRAHKLFRRFLDFSKFLTASSRYLWHHIATKIRTMSCFWKSNLFWKKSMKTASKSAYKRQRNACSNYAPLERTVRRPRSVTKTRSADADNGLDAFSGQSRSTNMVPFHMLHIVSYCALVNLSVRYSSSKNFMTLKWGSKVTQGHWEWYSINCVWFPISVLE